MSSNDPSPIRFRPSKKRKTYRQRPTSPDETATPALEPRARATAADYFDSKPSPEDVEPAVVRAAARPSRRGVGFGSTPRPSENDEQRLVVREERETGMGDRFVKYTDDRTVVDDRHMNAFIESRLSSHNDATSSVPKASVSAVVDEATIEHGETKTSTKHGNQIQEVDLPQQTTQTDERKIERPKKVRLGPDGKPWRGGRKKRRGSDDVARDRMVEELLHENRLDVYDHPAKAAEDGADGDADERVAAQFQQQYLEDVARKQQRQKAAQQKQKEEGEVLKGPKLGGSRNDRAAVREALLKTQREGQK